MKQVQWVEGGRYRYVVTEDYSVRVGIFPRWGTTGNAFVALTRDGVLHIRAGYAWDGASGIAINTPNSRTPSCIHDALYGLTREGLLDQSLRREIDNVFFAALIACGMWVGRAFMWWAAVRLFGTSYARRYAKPRNAE